MLPHSLPPISHSLAAVLRPTSAHPPTCPAALLQLVDCVAQVPDVVRGTAASALCRLLRCQPSCLDLMVEVGIAEVAAAGELCLAACMRRGGGGVGRRRRSVCGRWA